MWSVRRDKLPVTGVGGSSIESYRIAKILDYCFVSNVAISEMVSMGLEFIIFG